MAARAGGSGPPSAVEGSEVRLRVSMTRGRGNARRGHPVAKPGTSRRPSCPRSPAPRYLHCRAPGEGEGSGRRRALAWSTLSPTGESRPEGGVSGECLPWGSSALCGSPRRASPPTADIASGRIVSRVRCGHRGQGTPHPREPPWAEQNSAEGGDVGPGVVSSSVMAVNDGPGGRSASVGPGGSVTCTEVIILPIPP